MAKNGFKALDCDMHVLEPWDLWPRYIDREFRDRAPIGKNELFADSRLTVDGKIIRKLSSRPEDPAYSRRRQEALKDSARQGFDAVSQLQAMDIEGIDKTVLFPTRGQITQSMDYQDTRYIAAVARAYNNWLADFCKQDPSRLMGAAMISVHDIESGVIEARRCREELGFKGIFLRPNPLRGRNWHDPVYDPLWATCQELDMPVCFHEGSATELPEAVAERFGNEPELHWMTGHVASHPIEMMYAVLCMISGEVLERFPRLRVAFLEANSSWAPYWMWRLDAHHEAERHTPKTLKRYPSEYFKRQCFTSVEADEDIARFNVETLGDDHILFSTDYPHIDSDYPHAMESFLKLPFSKSTQKKILWDNSARLYGLSS